ncbi:MAG: hypothetical protein ACI909_002527 [Planctomycetota bacterium]|jgi:hypothetical protein
MIFLQNSSRTADKSFMDLKPLVASLIAFCLMTSLVLADECGSQVHLTEEQIATAREALIYAELANKIYGTGEFDNRYSSDGKWTISPGEEFRNTETGFHAAVYTDDKGNAILAFEGTNAPDWRDWRANFESAFGGSGEFADAIKDGKANDTDSIQDLKLTQQYAEAHRVALLMKEKYGDKLKVTGHSLGGGLAQFAAEAVGVDAYTFNAANLSKVSRDRLVAGHKPRVVNIVNSSELLNELNKISASLLESSKVGEKIEFDYELGPEKEPIQDILSQNVRDILSTISPLPNIVDDFVQTTIDDAAKKAAEAARRLYEKFELHGMEAMQNYLKCVAEKYPEGQTPKPDELEPTRQPATGTAGNDATSDQEPYSPGQKEDSGSSDKDKEPSAEVEKEPSKEKDECIKTHDPDAAVKIQEEYLAALNASDYGKLVALRAKKESMDLWQSTCN